MRTIVATLSCVAHEQPVTWPRVTLNVLAAPAKQFEQTVKNRNTKEIVNIKR